MLDFLQEALALAESRRGFTAPNPAVGAVLVRDGVVVGRGTHWAAGRPHAEVEAVSQAGDGAKGAVLYCTLEPCCHHGRTPPCTDLLIRTGVAKVVFAYEDPNPRVAGKGRRALEAAGIAVEHARLAAIDAFYESYARWTRIRLPRVTAKLAVSFDGAIAGPGGRPVKISGEVAAGRTHAERRLADAILTTARTVLADDPRLDARTGDGPHGKRVHVVDARAEVPPTAKLFAHAASVTIHHGPDAPAARLEALAAAGAVLVSHAVTEGRLDLATVLDAIGAAGAHDLWVEAGGTLVQALRDRGAVDRLLLYFSPTRLGPGAVPAFPGEGDFSPDFREIKWQTAGRDAIVELLR